MALNIPPILYSEYGRRVSRITDKFFLGEEPKGLAKLELSDTVESSLLEWVGKSVKSSPDDPKTQQTARLFQAMISCINRYDGQPVAKVTNYEWKALGAEKTLGSATELRLVKSSGGIKFVRRRNNFYLVPEGEVIFYVAKSPVSLDPEELELPERGSIVQSRFVKDFFPLMGEPLRGHMLSRQECLSNRQGNILYFHGKNLPGFSSVKELILAGDKAVGRYFSSRK